MSDKNTQKAPESGQPQAGVPQAVASDIAQLAAEVERMRSAASRSWKITAVVFIVLLAIIAGYLNFFVYRLLKEYLEPDSVVQIGVDYAQTALQAAMPGIPGLDAASMWPDWFADKAKAAAPSLVQEHLKPQIQDLIDKLPQHRADAVAWAKAELPKRVDQAVSELRTTHLPKLRAQLLHAVRTQLDAIMSQADEQLTAMVNEVLNQQSGALQVVGDEDTLKIAMENAFEEHLGTMLDEIFRGFGTHINSSAEYMEGLFANTNRTDLEKVEYRIIQITWELFGRAEEATKSTPGVAPAGQEAPTTRDLESEQRVMELLTPEQRRAMEEQAAKTREAGPGPANIGPSEEDRQAEERLIQQRRALEEEANRTAPAATRPTE